MSSDHCPDEPKQSDSISSRQRTGTGLLCSVATEQQKLKLLGFQPNTQSFQVDQTLLPQARLLPRAKSLPGFELLVE